MSGMCKCRQLRQEGGGHAQAESGSEPGCREEEGGREVRLSYARLQVAQALLRSLGFTECLRSLETQEYNVI